MSEVVMIGNDVDAAPPSRAAVRELGRIEAGRALRSAPFWLGLAATGLYFLNGADGPAWQSETYQLTGSVAFGPVCAGIFVAAVLAGSRDRATEVGLAEESPLDEGHRAAARLLGMLAQVAIVALVATAVAVITRVEGGFWIGNGSSRIDDAVHSWPELVQPVLAAAFAGASGIAIGRAVRVRTAVAVGGGLVWLLGSVVYWVWQNVPMRYVAVLQVQPIEVELPVGVDPSDLPGAQFSAPGEFQDAYRMVVVDQAMAAWHDLYLASLVLVCVALAVRGRWGRSLGVIGAIGAVVAVVLQIDSVPVVQIGG